MVVLVLRDMRNHASFMCLVLALCQTVLTYSMRPGYLLKAEQFHFTLKARWALIAGLSYLHVIPWNTQCNRLLSMDKIRVLSYCSTKALPCHIWHGWHSTGSRDSIYWYRRFSCVSGKALLRKSHNLWNFIVYALELHSVCIRAWLFSLVFAMYGTLQKHKSNMMGEVVSRAFIYFPERSWPHRYNPGTPTLYSALYRIWG